MAERHCERDIETDKRDSGRHSESDSETPSERHSVSESERACERDSYSERDNERNSESKRVTVRARE